MTEIDADEDDFYANVAKSTVQIDDITDPLHPSKIDQDIPIDPTVNPSNKPSSKAILLTDLTWWTTDSDIYEHIVKSGTEDFLIVNEIAFDYNTINGKSKGKVFIPFTSSEAAIIAKRYFVDNNIEINGKVPNVSFVPPNVKNPFTQNTQQPPVPVVCNPMINPMMPQFSQPMQPFYNPYAFANPQMGGAWMGGAQPFQPPQHQQHPRNGYSGGSGRDRDRGDRYDRPYYQENKPSSRNSTPTNITPPLRTSSPKPKPSVVPPPPAPYKSKAFLEKERLEKLARGEKVEEKSSGKSSRDEESDEDDERRKRKKRNTSDSDDEVKKKKKSKKHSKKHHRDKSSERSRRHRSSEQSTERQISSSNMQETYEEEESRRRISELNHQLERIPSPDDGYPESQDSYDKDSSRKSSYKSRTSVDYS